MRLFTPDYYNKFRCIADKCRHSCCIGWEIDIDSDTLAFYRTVTGSLGKKLELSIADNSDNIYDIYNDSCAHFILSENERCPFLNTDNLCEIIINLGEEHLCRICADHPRYRNFFDSRTEIGLGLCCEAAAKLILIRRQKTKMIMSENNDGKGVSEYDIIYDAETPAETAFFEFRNRLCDIVQNRSMTIEERVLTLLSDSDTYFPDKTLAEWAEIFLSLEQLDSVWTELLKKLKTSEFSEYKAAAVGSPINFKSTVGLDTAFEQLIVYFLFRHLADGLYDGLFKERAAFSVLGFYMLRGLCALLSHERGGISEEDFIEFARMYSAEIEYSQENTDTLLDILSQCADNAQ